MPRRKPIDASPAPASRAPEAPSPSSTSRLFQTRKPGERSGALTRERIAEHMAAFRKAGGAIEVLGTTRTLQRIGEAPEPATPPKLATPPRKRAR